MIPEKLYIALVGMMFIPIISLLLFTDPIMQNVVMIGGNLAILFYFRKTMKNVIDSKFGTKLKYQCLTCAGMKFDSTGKCYRCGRSQRRLG